MNLPTDVIPASDPKSNATQSYQWSGHVADDVASTYGPEPLASLTATPDELILTSTRGNFRLPRTAVIRIGRGDFYPWLFAAVRIHHSISGYPRALQFKPLGSKLKDVRLQLQALGYPS
ncbi:MAG: hypothetical protein Q8N18_09360 [Opitutaceae bacterium]|nr:hypothetical protein [Opitutaceae bacterium]